MKVLLINPWGNEILPPPAIGYLFAVLKMCDIEVKAMSLSQAMQTNEPFDITAVSFHSFSVKYAKQIRNKFKGHLICGGHHPSALPEQMTSIGYDQVVIGEGENAILDIICGNTDPIVKGSNKYFQDINDIPIPDYSGMPFSGEMGINIISSRGCPFDCSFCASSNFWQHKYKTRTAENVLHEIEYRISEGYKSWIFEDDNFTANKKRVFDICKYLDGKITWSTVGRAESMDNDICDELYRAGCRKIFLGIESLSQDALDRMGKNTTVEKMLKGIEIAEKAGIETVSLFLIGLPGDTIQNIHETAKNKKLSKIKSYGTNIAWILPKTEIHRKALEYGFNDSVYLESGAPFYTFEQSYETLQHWATLI